MFNWFLPFSPELLNPFLRYRYFYNLIRGYFRSIWTAVYQFWTPKLGKSGEKILGKVNTRYYVYFSFLAYQRKTGIYPFNPEAIDKTRLITIESSPSSTPILLTSTLPEVESKPDENSHKKINRV